MTKLQDILDEFSKHSMSPRDKGTRFEELTRIYFRVEKLYSDLYSDVWMYSEWAREQGLDPTDTGIDLVAKTRGTDEYHAIQCKFYDEGYSIRKEDLNSFFMASGQAPFTRRIIVTTTDNWTDNAERLLGGQTPPVNIIGRDKLESSNIDWSTCHEHKDPVLKEQHSLRPHQINVLESVIDGFKREDRGKLIMACGTGKTFVSLKIAEEQAGKGKRVLFLVPSLALLSQCLTEWTQQSETPLHSFAVCSDTDVGKKRQRNEDVVRTFAHELQYPATTDAAKLAHKMKVIHDKDHMSVVFATYHSIGVIHDAQKKHKLEDFDLIICDEAHRTTGATFLGEEESHFVKVHKQSYIKAAKRLYMTATPRIYSPEAKDNDDVELCSMDDKELFGETFHVITFGEAVQRGLLSDYKVIVLSIDKSHITRRLRGLLSDEDNQLKVDDAAKIVGCWKALSKQGLAEDVGDDTDPMQKALAFCQVIEANHNGRTHKVSSKQIAQMFQKVVEEYKANDDQDVTLTCEAEHVDGHMNAGQKDSKISWLKEEIDEDTCRILSNVRCLSEGVDVPALDAVLFLTPRNSQVDVVQSVGRVMRKAKGKQRGYVILPVVVPTDVEPHVALNDNKTYRVVWEVLQALRSHDDRFDAMINKMELVGNDNKKMEVVAVTDAVQRKPSKGKGAKKPPVTIGQEGGKQGDGQTEFQFDVGEIERAIYAKVVKKCGTRNYWSKWADDIAEIASTHILHIKTIIDDPKNKKEAKAFNDFAAELRDDLNDSITDDEVVEMLAQHLITKPVFDALFAEYSFASNNPVSIAMQSVLETLQEHNLAKEADTLSKFYASVKMRAEGINTAEAKQKIVIELYDKFFRNAFPKMTERLGIVYTPVEVVDFIIHSVNDLLKKEFDKELGSDGVHIIDPFVGTGTFITRLMQSGLISLDKLPHKYKNEFHANEIVLLAYYIAAINIEAVYHDLVGGEYQPYEGICLTDTFQMYEKDDLISVMLPDNSERRKRQKKLDIQVIMANPPYSSGDKGDTNNKNTVYPSLDNRIKETYVSESAQPMGKSKAYDSYIRGIRWASDRIGQSGVIGFVTNAGFLESSSSDGLRKCLTEEFSSIYIFHLRGNARTSGEQRRKEKGNVFGGGARTPIAISMLVKNPNAKEHGKIHFHDIGDYLSREEKLKIIQEFKSVDGISEAGEWQSITPDKHNDWLNQRDDSFDEFIKIGDKKDKSCNLFSTYSMGVKTNRDDWIYNFSKRQLRTNIKRTICFYNSEINRLSTLKPKDRKESINRDKTQIKLTSDLEKQLINEIKHKENAKNYRITMYRPFTKIWSYFDSNWNWTRHLMPSFFPTVETENRVISITGIGETKGFSVMMCETVPNLHLVAGGQCFPLYLYEDSDSAETADLFAKNTEAQSSGLVQQTGICDVGLKHYRDAYPNENVSKEDIFYYVYGLLHSNEYRTRFFDNLTKELPRIPCVKTAEDFWAFSKAGRDLADLHICYEGVDPYDVKLDKGKSSIKKLPAEKYYVTKMKFEKIKVDGKSQDDKTAVIYNNFITIRDIPLEAYEYVVNGKPALEWVMERQSVTTDKKSGIVNDANLWATETMNNPKYPLELFQRVITVSLETMKIVNALPTLDID